MGMLQDVFMGAGSRYKQAADSYKQAADKAADWNNINRDAGAVAANANANTRDSVYKQAKTLGYGKGLAMQKAKQAANESSSNNYKMGLDAAQSQADRKIGVAETNTKNQMSALDNQIKSSQQAFSNIMNTGAAIATTAGGGAAADTAKKFLNL